LLETKEEGFGRAIAVHGDRIAVGAPYDGTKGYYAGSVSLYRRRGPAERPWESTGVMYPPTENGQFGGGLAMDDTHLVVGSPTADEAGKGALGVVDVFRFDEDNPVHEATLFDDRGAEYGFAGSAIAISGNHIAVGASGDPNMPYNPGSVAIYRSDSDAWGLEFHVESPYSSYGDGFGRSLALTDSDLFVGAPGYATNSIFIFSGWSSGSPAIQTINSVSDSYTGFGSAMAFNGQTLFVGDYQASGWTGQVHVFRKDDDGSWSNTDSFTGYDSGSYSLYGKSVAATQTDLLVGATQAQQADHDYAGAVYAYSLTTDLTSVELTFPGLTVYSGTPGLYETKAGSVHIALSSPAPVGGLKLSLPSTSGQLDVPTAVTVPEGKNYIDVPFTTSAGSSPFGSSDTYVQIFASGPGVTTNSGLVVILGNKVAKVTGVTVNSFGEGTGKVTLAVPASRDYTVYLSSADSSLIKVPDSVTVPAGQTAATFTATSVAAVSTPTDVNISATPSNSEKKAKVTVLPEANIDSVTLASGTILAGSSTTATVTLAGPATPGGQVVSLSSSRATVTVPATVKIMEGQTTASFPVTSTGTSATSSVITASVNGARKTAKVTVVRPKLADLTVTDATVKGGVQNTSVTVTLTATVATDVTITLTSNNAALASVPATITIPAGQLSATGTVTTGRWSGATGKAVKITARYSSDSAKTVTVTVTK